MLRLYTRLNLNGVKVKNSIASSVLNAFSTDSQAGTENTNGTKTKITEKWDVLSAVCIERKPVVSKDLNEIELKVLKLFKRLENEESLKSNFELKYEEQTRQLEAWKKQRESDLATSEIPTIESQDILDKNTAELKSFKFAPRITEADKKNDKKSLERSLDSTLLFVVKKKLGDSDLWILPQDKNREDETLRQTAERIVKETCGDKLDVKIRSNAPCGFYKYKYPVQVRNAGASVGAKIFFYKAKYLKGSFESKDIDFQWAKRNELNQLFIPSYFKNVSMFLIDEESS